KPQSSITHLAVETNRSVWFRGLIQRSFHERHDRRQAFPFGYFENVGIMRATSGRPYDVVAARESSGTRNLALLLLRKDSSTPVIPALTPAGEGPIFFSSVREDLEACVASVACLPIIC